jgi:hypothetical protein
MTQRGAVASMSSVGSVTYVSGPDTQQAGGGGGIRTPETLSGLTVFKTAGFNRSPTPPLNILLWIRIRERQYGCSCIL